MPLPTRIAAAAFAATLALPAVAQEVVLKVHHFWPPGAMGPSTILAPWCDKIAKDSGNKMKCQIYPAMQLGGTPGNLIDQVKDGVVDIVWTLPGYTAGRFPMMEVFELPFMSSSATATSQAAWDYYTQYAHKEFPGIKALAVHVHDNGYIHTNPRQIKVMADFKGLRMRAPTRQTNKMLAALGANWKYFVLYVGMVVGVVFVHNASALATGYALAWSARLSEADRRAVAIECGIQNSGLGLILIFNFFDGLGGMAVVTAWWGIWHIVAGLTLSSFWMRRDPLAASSKGTAR